MNANLKNRDNCGRRGAALITVVFVALFLAALIIIAFAQSHNSARMAIMRENYANAVASAEYGAELAMAQLLTVQRADESTEDETEETSNSSAVEGQITGDFVFGEFSSSNNGNMYATSEGRADDQRRIAGIMDNQQFRVRVRSARLAHSNDTMMGSWLDKPAPFDYDSAISGFKDIYEITATAQNHLAASGTAVQAHLYPIAVVRSVVKLDVSGGGDAVDEYGTLDADPEHIQAVNMTISGEDHNLRKFFIEGGGGVYIPPSTGAYQGSESEAEWQGADGTFWRQGNITLNYMKNDFPIPYYPATKYFLGDPRNPYIDSALNKADPPADVTMATIGKIGDASYLDSPVDYEADTYLVGGKTKAAIAADPDAGITSSAAVGYSVTLDNSVPPLIKERTLEDAKQGGRFDIVLGDYDDLSRIYIVRSDNLNDGAGVIKGNARIKESKIYVSSKREEPYNSAWNAAPPYGENKSLQPIEIVEDANVNKSYMNFLGRKLNPLDVVSNAKSLTSISPRYFFDPWDNAEIKDPIYRMYAKQWVLRKHPDPEKEGQNQILALRLQYAKKPEAIQLETPTSRYIEGLFVDANNRYLRWNGASHDNKWQKITLWEVIKTYADGTTANFLPVYYFYDKDIGGHVPFWKRTDAEGNTEYVPVDYLIIRLRAFDPNTSDKVTPERVKAEVEKIWPGLLDVPNRDAEGNAIDREYVIHWDQLGLVNGIKDIHDDEAIFCPESRGVYVYRQGSISEQGVRNHDWYEWDGTFFWSDWNFVGESGTLRFEKLPEEGGAKSPGPGNQLNYLRSGFNLIPRPFEIDELIGMKMDFDYRTLESNYYGKIVVVDKDGNAIEKDKDNNEYPGHIPLTLRTPKPNAEGKYSGFRAAPDADEKDYTEGLVVYESFDSTEEPKIYTTMNDFLEPYEFTAADGSTVERKAVSLLVGMEDQISSPDWDVNDVSFIVTIAPPVPQESGKKIINSVEKYSSQWWEQHEQEGLTGGESNAAISTNRIEGSDDPAKAYELLWNKLTIDDWFSLSVERRAALKIKAEDMGVNVDNINPRWYTAESKAAFGTAQSFEEAKEILIAVLASDVWSMMNTGTREYTGFEQRGEFYCDYISMPWSEGTTLPVAVHLRNAHEIPYETTIYYSNNDIQYYRAVYDSVHTHIFNDYWLFFSENGQTDIGFDGLNGESIITDSDGVKRWTRKGFMNMWAGLGENEKMEYAKRRLIYNLTRVDSYPGDGKALFILGEMESTESGIDPSPYSEPVFPNVEFISERDDMLYHLLVAVNRGGLDADGKQIPNALKVRDQGITPREFSAAVFNQKETLVRQALQTVVTADLDQKDDWTTFRPAEGGNPTYRAQTLTFLAGEMKQDPTQRTVVPTGDIIPFNTNFRHSNGTKYEISDKFLAKSEDPEDVAAAVAECYRPFYESTPSKIDEIHEDWGLKDNRSSIGWHRYGLLDEDDPEYQSLVERNLLDRLEIVMLGVRNFIPYYTIAGEEQYEGKTLIQRRRTYKDLPSDPDFSTTSSPYEEEVPLRTGRAGEVEQGMPTFVFDKEIDGAGIMVVNGNLLVKDTFAYHGILVVLGKIEIQGTSNPDRILYGRDGNPYFVSKDGTTHSLRQDEQGKYYYLDEDDNKVYQHAYEDENGNMVTEDVAPQRAKDDPDASNYTGRLVVQGGVVAGGEITTTSEGDGVPAGSFEVYHSQTVKDQLKQMIPPGTPILERLVWDHNDNINVTTLWNDKLDPKRGGSSSED